MIRISSEKSHRLLTVEKQRDASDQGEPIPFLLLPIEIPGSPERASACTIKVVMPTPGGPKANPAVDKEDELVGAAGLVLEILAPLSKGSPVLETVAKKAVVDQTLLRCNNSISREAAAKRFSRGRDELLKRGLLIRDQTAQTLIVRP